MGARSEHMQDYVTLTIPGDLLPCYAWLIVPAMSPTGVVWDIQQKLFPYNCRGISRKFMLDMGRFQGLRDEIPGVPDLMIGLTGVCVTARWHVQSMWVMCREGHRWAVGAHTLGFADYVHLALRCVAVTSFQ